VQGPNSDGADGHFYYNAFILREKKTAPPCRAVQVKKKDGERRIRCQREVLLSLALSSLQSYCNYLA